MLGGHVGTVESGAGASQIEDVDSKSVHFFWESWAYVFRGKESLLKTSPVKLKELLGPKAENEFSAT